MLTRSLLILTLFKLSLNSNISYNSNKTFNSDTPNNPTNNNPNTPYEISPRNCDTAICPSKLGKCINSKCECYYQYTTLTSNFNGKFCNYKKHLRVTAFFLEFFFPIGLGHLYTDKLKLAIFKFVSFMIFFTFFCGEFFCIRCKLSALNKCHLYLAVFILFDLFVWICLQICDLVSYGFGFYYDGNGVELI